MVLSGVAPSNGVRIATLDQFIAGWSSPVAHLAHNQDVVGSNPTPATKIGMVVKV